MYISYLAHVLALLDSFSTWSSGTLSITFMSLSFQNYPRPSWAHPGYLTLRPGQHPAPIASSAFQQKEGSLSAAARAAGPLCGRPFSLWSLECNFVWPNHFLAETSAVSVKAAIVNTERRQVDRVIINVKLQKPLNPLEAHWLFLTFFPRTPSGLI